MSCKMFYFKLIIFSHILILIYAGYIQDKLMNSKKFQVVRINGECRGRNVLKQSYHQGIRSGTWELFVANTTLKVKENLVDNLKMTITINKCRSRENLDSCEEVYNYKDLDYCQSIDPDNLVTSRSPFAIHYQPKVKCPIKQGIYRAYNTTLSLAPFMFLKLENYYYRLKCEIFPPNSNRLIYCLEAEAQIINNSQ